MKDSQCKGNVLDLAFGKDFVEGLDHLGRCFLYSFGGQIAKAHPEGILMRDTLQIWSI